MEEQFWRDIWEQESQGFHEGAPNAFLVKHIERLRDYSRILVPLCGRSHDLAFLANAGHEVVGVELVEHAARGFFDQCGMEATEDHSHGFLTLRSGAISIVVANVLELTPAHIGTFDAVYDRAAAVALPEDTRLAYAKVIQKLLRPNGVNFVVTFVDATRETGPPHSVNIHDVQRMYPSSDVEIIDVLEPAPSTDDGLPQSMTQKVFWVT